MRDYFFPNKAQSILGIGKHEEVLSVSRSYVSFEFASTTKSGFDWSANIIMAEYLAAYPS